MSTLATPLRSSDAAAERAKFELLLSLIDGGQRAQMRAFGRSMRSAIEAGTDLELAPKRRHPVLFDVVVVEVGGELVIHRIIGWGRTPAGDEVLIAGDNNPRPDGWVLYATVRARVARAKIGGEWQVVADPFRAREG